MAKSPASISSDSQCAKGLVRGPRTVLCTPSYQAPVAQLDRVSPSEGEGQRFESSRARHFLENGGPPLNRDRTRFDARHFLENGGPPLNRDRTRFDARHFLENGGPPLNRDRTRFDARHFLENGGPPLNRDRTRFDARHFLENGGPPLNRDRTRFDARHFLPASERRDVDIDAVVGDQSISQFQHGRERDRQKRAVLSGVVN